MDQPRILEEGLARTTTESDYPISPTDTVTNLASISEKGSYLGCEESDGAINDDQRPRENAWSNIWNKIVGKRDHNVSQEDDALPNYQIRELERFPEGYPNLAAFQDSDESFMIYRRFGYLQSRVLLAKQEEMRELEEQLDAVDTKDRFDEPDALRIHQWKDGHADERRALLRTIETKYLEYARFLATAHEVTALNKPASHEHRSVSTYLDEIKPVAMQERSYINYKEDLVTLRPGREHAWLDTIIEKSLRIFRCRLTEYLFCDELAKRKTTAKEGAYYSRERIEKCAVICITTMILALLIVPIYLLYTLVSNNINDGTLDGKSNAICIGVLLVFTLAFSAMMSLFTRAKRHEILGAAAAYCAVLVVFFGNVGNNN